MRHLQQIPNLLRERRAAAMRLLLVMLLAAGGLLLARHCITPAQPKPARGVPDQLVVSPPPDLPDDTASLRSIPAPEEETREEGGGPARRLDWFTEQRAYPRERLPTEARLKAYEEMQRMDRLLDTQAQETWENIGPAPMRNSIIGQQQVDVTGRVTALAVDPRDPNVIYLGAAQGGLWKSNDDGASWTPLTDDQPSLAVGALTLDPQNPDTIYVGTGEPHASMDSYYGAGILKSTNAGKTWQQLGATQFTGLGISAIIVHPSNANTVYAASSAAVGPDGPRLPSQGVFQSTDGGQTWHGLRVCNSCYGASDLIMDRSNPLVLYAAFWFQGIFKSTDGGQTWQQLVNGLPAQDFQRIELAIAPSDPAVLYAGFDMSIPGQYTGAQVFKSTDGGASWQQLRGAPNYCGGQCWYDNIIAVHPYNPDIVYLGGSANYISLPRWSIRQVIVRSTDGGSSWWDLSPNDTAARTLHPDMHAIAFDAQNPQVLWIGNDGGVWKSTDGGLSWINKNSNLATLQFIGVATHPTDPNLIFGGMQDNNKAKYEGAAVWEAMDAGDGGYAAIDPFDPRYFYGTRYGISFQRNDRGGTKPFNEWPVKTSGIDLNDRSLFYPPFEVDPSTPGVLYFGTYRLYRTANRGDRWQAISGDLTRGGSHAGISTIAVSPSAPSVLYVGSSDGQVHVTTDSGKNWENVTKAPLPNRFVSELVVSPTSSRTAYVVFNGFNTHTPMTPGHVFQTTDGGVSWRDISANLPDIPVLCIALDRDAPGTIYVGTDVGVFRSTNTGASWAPFSNGMANVAVFDVALNPDTDILVAATHGRSVYRLRLGGEPTPTPTPTSTRTATPSPTPTHTEEPGASPTPSATEPTRGRILLPVVLKHFVGPGPVVTATATPEPTPAWPLPPSPLTFSDDFSDPESGWPEESSEPCVTRYVDGQYEIRTSSTCAQWAPTTHDPSGMVKVTAQSLDAEPGVYGLVFGGRMEPLELYVFWLDPNQQQYALQQLQGATWRVLVDWTLSGAVANGDQDNHLAVRQDGERIHLYVNGQYLIAVPDDMTPENNLVGVVHWARQGEWATGRFDDFQTTAPTVAFEDDFSDPDSGWDVDAEDECQSAYDAQEFRITTAASGACLQPAPSYPLADGHIEVQARCSDSLYPTIYGLAFAGDAFSNVSRFYALWISPDSRQFSLFKYDSGWEMLQPWTSTDAIAAGLAVNHMSIVRDGARMHISINGQSQLTVEDSALLGNGYFGLLNWASPYAPGTTYFDNMRVTIWDVVPEPSQVPSGWARTGVMGLPSPDTSPR
jgi:photosystem II stability/assembly factor-like uncharacterized protein